MSPEQPHVSWRKRTSLPGRGTTRTKVLSVVRMSCIPGRDRRVGGLPKSAAGGTQKDMLSGEFVAHFHTNQEDQGKSAAQRELARALSIWSIVEEQNKTKPNTEQLTPFASVLRQEFNLILPQPWAP